MAVRERQVALRALFRHRQLAEAEEPAPSVAVAAELVRISLSLMVGKAHQPQVPVEPQAAPRIRGARVRPQLASAGSHRPRLPVDVAGLGARVRNVALVVVEVGASHPCSVARLSEYLLHSSRLLTSILEVQVHRPFSLGPGAGFFQYWVVWIAPLTHSQKLELI